MNKTLIVCTLLCVSSSAFIVGCGSKDEYDKSSLEAITNSTGTTAKQRTPEWYESNDFVRNDVLTACSNIQEEITGKTVINKESNFNIFSKESDCASARAANIKVIKDNTSGVMNYYEYDKINRKYSESSNVDTTKISADDMKLLKSLSNETNTNIDNYSVGTDSDGKDNYADMQKLLENEIKKEQQNQAQN